MRKFVSGRIALPILAALVLLAGTALAAGNVKIQVLSNNQPLTGAAVEVLATDGSHSFVTDQNGNVSADLNGTAFRVKVNGQLQPGMHRTDELNITINVH